jgi:tetratricopeptide (TPR) repeat protein
MTDDDKDTLRAASFEPQSEVPASPASSERSGDTVTWLAILLACVLAAMVVFILPKVTDSSEAQLVFDSVLQVDDLESGDGGLKADTDPPPAVSERSPFSEAQIAKARRAAQEVLQLLLETQTKLEARAVETWGKDSFLRAQDIAVKGDEHYRSKEFFEAQQSYQSSLSLLENLQARLDIEIERQLKQLLAAIESGDQRVANELIKGLTMMAPDSAAVSDAAMRVSVMPEIAQLEEAAEADFSAENFKSATSKIEEALALDSTHSRLTKLLRSYSTALQRQKFDDAMTRGFTALNNKRFSEARAHFESAERLNASDSAVAIAMAQLDEEEALSKLRALLSQAEQFSRQEQWKAAVTAYEDALAIDASLVEAMEGLAISAPISELFEDLDLIVEKQARLVDPVVLKEAVLTLNNAKSELAKAHDSMPVLEDKIAQVKTAITIASTPLPVLVSSDGLTEVTIKRVVRLGKLTRKTVPLRPGQYQFLGSRDGYRDVLLTASINQNTENTIDVRCTEAIAR